MKKMYENVTITIANLSVEDVVRTSDGSFLGDF